MKLSKSHKFLIIIMLTSVILRVLWILYNLDSVPNSDDKFYFRTASDIAQGLGYNDKAVKTARWPIGWPAFLGLAFNVFGTSVFVGQSVNLLLSISVMALTYLLAQQQFCSRRISLIALTIIAFFPNQIVYPVLLYSELLFQFFFLLVSYLMFFILTDGIKFNTVCKYTLYALHGIIFGLSLYLKPIFIFFPIFSILTTFTNRHRFNNYIIPLMIIYFIGIIIQIPWIVRNYKVWNEFVFVSTNGGVNLYIGNNPKTTGQYMKWFEGSNLQDSTTFSQFKTEPQKDKYLRKVAINFIIHNPGKFVVNFFKKMYYMWYSDADGYSDSIMNKSQRYLKNTEFSGNEKIVKWLFQAYYLIILITSSLSLIIINKRSYYLYSTIIYFIIIYGIFFGKPRYHFPLIPIISILSAFSMYNYKRILKKLGYVYHRL